MGKGTLLFYLLVVFIFSSCKESPDYDSIRSEILDLHRAFINAHLAKDASFIAKPTSPDYLFVSNGEIQKITPAQMEDNLSEYLNSTEFKEYRDLDEPIIGVSQDGLLAWAVVKVRTAGVRKKSDGKPNEFDIQWRG